MRHITDGELHAYLDGALDLLPPGRADEIRSHLDSCGACQERLQDEGRVREQAQGLLDSASPGDVAAPPFEELRARAESLESVPSVSFHDDGNVVRRGPLTGANLAWAATVVLALGVGWMSGEMWRGSAVDELPALSFPETMAEPASEMTRQPEAMAPTRVGEADAAATAPGPGEEEEAPRRGSGGTATDVSSTPMTPPPLVSAAPGETRADLAEGRSGILDGIGVDHSLAVPGLAVLSVEWEEWVPGEKALHIRQLLPPSDTLELRYLGMLMGLEAEGTGRVEGNQEAGVAPRVRTTEAYPFPKVMEASLPKGWNQVVVRRGRGWLVARAPLPEASLRALVRSLQGG